MYKIIIDSCGELTDSLKKDGHFCNVCHGRYKTADAGGAGSCLSDEFS